MTPALASLKSDRINVAADADETLYVVQPYAGTWKVRKAYLVPHDTTAANASNYVSVALKNGSTTLGTIDTSSTGNTAGTAREFTLSGGSSLEVAQGSVFTVAVTHPGTGAALDAYVAIELEKVGR